MTDKQLEDTGATDSDGPVTSAIPRRVAVAGIVVMAGVAAGCAQGGDTNGATSAPESGDAADGDAPAGTVLGNTADVPVGGGRVFKDQRVVVTQPTEGVFKGFSAVCTHKGCLVASVAEGTINCDCHGSKFAIADGSVASAPARQPLPAQQLRVEGDRIVLA